MSTPDECQVLSLWQTIVTVQQQNLGDDFNTRLNAIAIKAERNVSPSGSFYDRTGYYNLFDLDDPDIRVFANLMSHRFRAHLYLQYKDAYAYHWDVSVRAFANVYDYGQRIRPHYHHACDFVSVYYTELGDGSKPDFKTNEAGRLVVIDPRGAVQYPFSTKCQRVPTEKGCLVIHPAYLEHESETHFAKGLRVMVACEFTILHGQRRAFGPLPQVDNPNPPPILPTEFSGDTIYHAHYK